MRNIYNFSTLALAAAFVLTGSNSGLLADDIRLTPAERPAGVKMDVSEDKLLVGAENFVSSMATRAIGFLGDEGLNHDQRRAHFRKLLHDSFDMRTIGRFSLGRYWRVSTKQQKEEYLSLFEDMIVNVYSERFAEYKGQDLKVHSARPEGEADAIVTSYIQAEGGPQIQVDWRVRYKDGRYKVIDVVVEGVSMAVTQRSDFSSVIQRGGGQVNVLLAHLRQ